MKIISFMTKISKYFLLKYSTYCTVLIDLNPQKAGIFLVDLIFCALMYQSPQLVLSVSLALAQCLLIAVKNVEINYKIHSGIL